MSKYIPAHIRGAIVRDLAHLETSSGTPAVEAFGLKHNCYDSAWRWLDCAECKAAGKVCDAKVCVECGADVGVEA